MYIYTPIPSSAVTDHIYPPLSSLLASHTSGRKTAMPANLINTMAILPRATIALALATATATDGPGLFVYDKTGPLSRFTEGDSEISWRYNGDLLAWGDDNGTEFVPMVRNESIVGDVQSAHRRWFTDSEITHVLSFESRELANMASVCDCGLKVVAHTDVFGTPVMDAAKAANLHGLWVSIVDPRFKIGSPSMYFDIMVDGRSWFDVSTILSCPTAPPLNSQDFSRECTGPCRFDFIPIEYMGDSVQDLREAIEVCLLGSRLRLIPRLCEDLINQSGSLGYVLAFGWVL
jgi:hypothetical protein